MNYIRIDKDNLINGPGIRLVLWVSGCNNFCKNCHNPESWDKNFGESFTNETLKTLVKTLGKDYYDGLTITGGDPFFIDSRETIRDLVKLVKQTYPEKTIWIWSGHKIEDLIPEFFTNGNTDSLEYELLSYIDVLVDGKFDTFQREIDLKDPQSSDILKYRGSSNQRIININKTLTERKVVLNG